MYQRTDHIYKHKQVFPWNPSQSTPGDRLQKKTKKNKKKKTHKSLPLMPLRHKHQETDYIRTNKFSPGIPFRTPGDRLHKHSRTSLPLGPFSECIRGQTTYKTDKFSPGTLLRVSQGTDYTKTKAFPWDPSRSIPRDRLHKHIRVFPWHLSKSHGTDSTDKTALGTTQYMYTLGSS